MAETIARVLHCRANDNRSHRAFHRCGEAQNQRDCHFTRSPQVYHALNLFWGLKPLLVGEETFRLRRTGEAGGIDRSCARGLAKPLATRSW